MAKRAPFVFQGEEHWTGGDLLETILLLDGDEEAEEFFEAYVAVCDDEAHATHNIGYLIALIRADDEGDGGEEEANRLVELFEISDEGKMAEAKVHWFKKSSLGIIGIKPGDLNEMQDAIMDVLAHQLVGVNDDDN